VINASPAVFDDCDKILESATHLLSLINGVLDLSKIEAGKMQLSCEEFLINELVDSVLGIIKPLAEKNGNHISVDYQIQSFAMVSDAVKVKQILMNLVSNANKFTSDGSIAIKISSIIENGITCFNFRVKDNGIGIEPGQLGKVFDPFEQADVSMTRQYQGTGLGLTITKRFCEMLGGAISITSAPGKGTACSVILPARGIKSGKNTLVRAYQKLAS